MTLVTYAKETALRTSVLSTTTVTEIQITFSASCARMDFTGSDLRRVILMQRIALLVPIPTSARLAELLARVLQVTSATPKLILQRQQILNSNEPVKRSHVRQDPGAAMAQKIPSHAR